jgi:DnaJ-class molecular chaperone
MTLKEIYRSGKKVIILKNKDILEFEVTPYNFKEDIQILSKNNMLYIVSVKVNDSKWWLDDKMNLHTTVSIPLYDCMLGCITAIEYLDGEMMKIDIPNETYNTIRLSGLGWPIRQNKRTDLVIHINIEFPRNISEYEREILKTLQKIEKIKKSNSGSST